MKRRMPRLDQWPWIWAAIAMVLVGTVVSLSVALHASNQSTAAARQGLNTANCVNAILAVRSPLTNADHANERRKIEDQKKAEIDKERGLTALSTAKTKPAALAGFHLYQRGVAEFVKALDDWIARDDKIAAEKALHPLGAC